MLYDTHEFKICKIIGCNILLTFGDRKETKEHNTITMCSLNIIVYIANRQIDRPILIVASSYRYSGLVAAKNDRAKDRAMSFRILSNNVLVYLVLIANFERNYSKYLLLDSRPNFLT